MLDVADFKQSILEPILARFASEESLANAYCVIWAIDAFATHVGHELKGKPSNPAAQEIKFKNSVSGKSWEFRVIREASNATKHAIRKSNAKDVLNSDNLKPDTGISWYAYFSGVDGGVTIETDWEYRKADNTFFDADGEKIEGYNGVGPDIFLSKITHAAIRAIEREGGFVS